MASKYKIPVFKPLPWVLPFLTPCSALTEHMAHWALAVLLTAMADNTINMKTNAILFITANIRKRNILNIAKCYLNLTCCMAIYAAE